MKSRIEQLKEYLEKDPLDSFSNYALALEYMHSNEDKAAVEILERVLERNKEYLAAYYQLGKMYEKISKMDKARLVYEKGMEVAARQKKDRTFNELKSAFDSLNEDE